jgi:hypothetical protein
VELRSYLAISHLIYESVGFFKLFLGTPQHALGKVRHFALVEQSSHRRPRLVLIVRVDSVAPNHLFGRNLDHD